MKTKHLFWGTLFISIGILVLLNNFNSIDLDWSNLWKFWPVVLVLWGATIIVKDKFFKGMLAGLSGLILALVIFASFKTTVNVISDNFDWNDSDFNVSIDGSDVVKNYNEPFNPMIKKASLDFDAGAGSFLLNSTTDDLFSATTNDVNYNYNIVKNENDSTVSLIMDMEEHHFRFSHGKLKNKVKMELNVNPVWDLEFNIGAASAEFDLSKFKTKNVDIEMGAASLKLKLSDLLEESKVKISGGASAIHIYIPDDAGCDIKTDISLSSKNFKGFNKISSDHYRTDNFNSAKSKIYLNLEAGVSSITVKRTSDW
ncbi:MAG TPA: DUF5668 domain-containing protein [Ignavibacteriaceae bacterium]|nr:DUF5668 domain-containing protein [Ignavibacteriaceae bacterium]